jgi:hypothetical protein
MANDSVDCCTAKLDPVLKYNYLFEMGGLTSLMTGDHVNYQFYKEEEKI